MPHVAMLHTADQEDTQLGESAIIVAPSHTTCFSSPRVDTIGRNSFEEASRKHRINTEVNIYESTLAHFYKEPMHKHNCTLIIYMCTHSRTNTINISWN
jgi:hypothetical protein